MRHPCGDVPQPKSPGHRGNALNSRRGLEGCSGASGDALRSGRNCGGIGGRFGQIAANPNRNRRKIALPGQMRRKPADRATRFPRVGAGGEGPWGDVRACRGRGDGSGKAQRGIFPGLPHFCVRAAKKVMQIQGVFPSVCCSIVSGVRMPANDGLHCFHMRHNYGSLAEIQVVVPPRGRRNRTGARRHAEVWPGTAGVSGPPRPGRAWGSRGALSYRLKIMEKV